jgi:hypothetical protein
MSVLDSIPEENRAIFAEVIGSANAQLLASLEGRDEPSIEERKQVEDILSAAFMRCLQLNYESTARGVAIDNTIGAFLMRWPIEATDAP